MLYNNQQLRDPCRWEINVPKQLSLAVVPFLLVLAGCEAKPSAGSAPPSIASAVKPAETPEDVEIAKERAKLSAEDRALVEAQEWCVISEDERLGSMGAPIKLTLKGKTVFICCGGCKKKAEANPEATLAKLEE